MSGSRKIQINSPHWRDQLNTKCATLKIPTSCIGAAVLFSCTLLTDSALGQTPPPAGPATITLEDAIRLASRNNHGLLAARTTVAQNQALEVQANVRPNPTLFTDWEYLPLPGVHPAAVWQPICTTPPRVTLA